MVNGIWQQAITDLIAPTARPYLNPLEAPCFGIAWSRSMKACCGVCLGEPAANGEHVDALFGADAGDRNVDGVDKLRRSAVCIDRHDGQAAADTGIDAEDPAHGSDPLR